MCHPRLHRQACRLQDIQSYLSILPGTCKASVIGFYRSKNDSSYIFKDVCKSERSEIDCQGRSVPPLYLDNFKKRLDKCLRNDVGRDDPAMEQTDELEELFKSHATFLFLFQLFSLVPTFSPLGNKRTQKCYLIASFLNTVRF